MEWKRNRKGLEKKQKRRGNKGDWNGSGMDNFRLKKTMCKKMEMEWKKI